MVNVVRHNATPKDIPLGPLDDHFKFFLASLPLDKTAIDIKRFFQVSVKKAFHDKNYP
jgi:hypothetical protein